MVKLLASIGITICAIFSCCSLPMFANSSVYFNETTHKLDAINVLSNSIDSTTQNNQDTILRKTNSLKDDIYLHPIDCITPYTLQKENGFTDNHGKHFHFRVGHFMVLPII